MWLAVRQLTPKTADVAVTKIAGYVRVRMLMNWWFFFVFFGIHSFYATATLLNMSLSPAMNVYGWLTQLAVVVGQIGLCTHACSTLRRPVWRKHSNIVASLEEPLEGRC